MRALVTGGMGYIGRHVVTELLARGSSVLVLDDTSSAVDDNIRKLRASVDWLRMRCEDWTANHAANNPVDLIIHCAGRADISNNWHPQHPNRLAMWRGNLETTVALLEAMTTKPVPFVLLSTAAVYGSRSALEGGKLHEDLAPLSESPYAASKIAAESALFAYAKKLGFPAYALRLSQVVGAGYHHGHVYDFVKRFDAGENPLQVRDDGRQKKSAVHVGDVADAAFLLPIHRAPSGVYNVTSDEMWSVRDTVRVMGCEAVYATASSAWVGDPQGLTLDSTKLAAFSPCKRSVEEGVRQAIWSIRAQAPRVKAIA